MTIDLQELVHLESAISHVIGYLTDNSCSDPDCCGGPYYTDDDYQEGISLLRRYNIEVDA